MTESEVPGLVKLCERLTANAEKLRLERAALLAENSSLKLRCEDLERAAMSQGVRVQDVERALREHSLCLLSIPPQ